MIVVRTCPNATLERQQSFGPAYLIAIGEPGSRGRRPRWIASHNYLNLCFKDADSADHPEAPRRRDVGEIVKFARRACDPESDAHVLVTCGGGVSRSSATAFILYCVHLGPGREDEALEQAAAGAERPWIWPNVLMVQYADDLLRRDGRMVDVLAKWKRRNSPTP